MATFTYCLESAQVKDYIEGTLNLNDIFEELADEMISEYLRTGDEKFKVYLTKYAGYDEKYDETYEDDIDTLYTDIDEILTDYVNKEDLIDIFKEAVESKIEIKDSLKAIVDDYRNKENK